MYCENCQRHRRALRDVVHLALAGLDLYGDAGARSDEPGLLIGDEPAEQREERTF